MNLFWKIIGNWILPIFSIISAGVCIFALCKHAPRTNLEFDYMGVIVGLFGLIITILIGWQVYKSIKTDKIQEKLIQLQKYTEAETNILIANTLFQLNRYIEAIYRIIQGLKLYAEIEDYRPDISTEIRIGIYNCAVLLYKGKGHSKHENASIEEDKKFYYKITSDERPNFSNTEYNNDFKLIYDFIKKISKILDNEHECSKLDWNSLSKIKGKYEE